MSSCALQYYRSVLSSKKAVHLVFFTLLFRLSEYFLKFLFVLHMFAAAFFSSSHFLPSALFFFFTNLHMIVLVFSSFTYSISLALSFFNYYAYDRTTYFISCHSFLYQSILLSICIKSLPSFSFSYSPFSCFSISFSFLPLLFHFPHYISTLFLIPPFLLL